MLWHRRDGHCGRDVYGLDGQGGDKDRASQVQSCGGGVRGEGGADLQYCRDSRDGIGLDGHGGDHDRGEQVQLFDGERYRGGDLRCRT